MLGDERSEVRNQTWSVVQTRTFDDSMLPHLQITNQVDNWTARVRITILAAKIKTTPAREFVIRQLLDTRSEVRNQSASLLESKALSDALIPALSEVLNGDIWTSRRVASELLGKIHTQGSLDTLLDRLSVEARSEVKSQILASIETVRAGM